MKLTRRQLKELNTEIIFLNELYNNLICNIDDSEFEDNIRNIKFTLMIINKLINSI